MANKTRTSEILFRVTPEEKKLIRQKMEQIGAKNMEVYLRKMALNGYVMKLDLPGARELSVQLSRMSANLNQIAKRLNASGRIYEEDLQEIRQKQSDLQQKLREILIQMEKMNC